MRTKGVHANIIIFIIIIYISCVFHALHEYEWGIHQHEDLIIRYKCGKVRSWVIEVIIMMCFRNTNWKKKQNRKSTIIVLTGAHFYTNCKLTRIKFSSNGFLISRFLWNRLIWKWTYQYFLSVKNEFKCSPTHIIQSNDDLRVSFLEFIKMWSGFWLLKKKRKRRSGWALKFRA